MIFISYTWMAILKNINRVTEIIRQLWFGLVWFGLFCFGLVWFLDVFNSDIKKP